MLPRDAGLQVGDGQAGLRPEGSQNHVLGVRSQRGCHGSSRRLGWEDNSCIRKSELESPHAHPGSQTPFHRRESLLGVLGRMLRVPPWPRH